ncbi:MAG: type 1 glutamine amidotransferase domain-containing protein [Phycisphaerales bacterium JB060]
MTTTLRTLALLLLILIWLALAGCQSGKLAPSDARPAVLLVLTNHGQMGGGPGDQMGDTGEPTGFYLSEAAHPWHVFNEAGWIVVLASPRGGDAPIDPRSLEGADEQSRAFLKKFAEDGRGGMVVPGTATLENMRASAFEAIFFAGGHGTMWDFPQGPGVRETAEGVYRSGGVVAAVCHGPAALVNLRGKDGQPLVAGRRVTGFTNAEEEAVGLTGAMPFLLETRLGELGAQFVGAGNFEKNVVVDGRLVTGQNPASARAAAEAVVEIAAADDEG